MADVRTDPMFEQGFGVLRALIDEAEHEAHRGAWKDTVKATAACKNQLDILQKQAMMLRDGALCEVGSQMTLPGGGPESENYTPPAEDDPGLRFLTTDSYRSMLELVEHDGGGGMTSSELADSLSLDEGEVYQMAEFATRRGTFERDGQLYKWLGENALPLVEKPACIVDNDELYEEMKQELQQAGTSGLTSDALAKAVGIDPQDAYEFCEWFHARRGCRLQGSAYLWLDDPDLDDPFEDDDDDDNDDPEARVGLHAVEQEPLPDGVSEAMEPAEA